MPSRPHFIYLTLVIYFGFSPFAIGQEMDKRSESHISIPFDRGNLEALRERFKRLDVTAVQKPDSPFQNQKFLENLKQITEQLEKDPKIPQTQGPQVGQQQEVLKKLKQITERLKKDPNDGKSREEAWKLLQEPEFKGLGDQLKSNGYENPLDELQKLGQGIRGNQQSPTETQTGQASDGPGQGEPGDQDAENAPPPHMMRLGLPSSSSGSQSGATSSTLPEKKTPAQELRRWLADNVNPTRGPLADSPAFQEMLRELRRTPLISEPPAADDSSWAGKVARSSESITQSDIWSKVDWPNLKNWRLPSTKGLPKIQSPIGAPSFGGMPNVNLPGPTTLDRGLQIMWVVIMIAAGVLVWRLLRGYVPGTGRFSRRGWVLGPWPVRPGAVTTRQDVIQAFEYLSFLQVGPEAQSRNHLDLAVQLGQSDGAHRRSADRLAAVYEQARYAPANEPLSADAVTAARNELCLLAGVKD
jgi:hypothetical protein